MTEDNRTHFDKLKEFVKEAPLSPGVYIMKDESGKIIYVGKAKVLKNRLSSYFTGAKDIKTRSLVSKVRSIEFIALSHEYEALLLENTLIKQHSPRYNINLKDGKTYPAIRVTNEEYPRVFRTRRIINDGSIYYGPFPSVQTIDTFLELINEIFPLRRCRIMRKRQSPCMYYHIGRCSAPCAGKIDKEGYMAQVERVKKLLSGESAELVAELEEKMNSAAKELKFELAGRFRDTITAINNFKVEQSAVDFDLEDRDYIAWAEEAELISFVVFQMRGGKMTGRDLFRSKNYSDETSTLESFLVGYYGPGRKPPPRVFIPKKAKLPLVLDYFRKELGTESALLVPDERRHDAVMKMAFLNAKEDISSRLRESGDLVGIEELKRVFALEKPPVRIEGFDIAQLSGKFPVASLISFKNGVPDKKNYRHFRLKTLKGKIDDFESMREAVARRYSRLVNEGAELPDLILIDGGIGQVNAAYGVLSALELDIPVVGLAKRDEELWLPNAKEAICLPKGNPALRVLQNVRDETHRFATGLNQRLRTKEVVQGGLEQIAGIGPARRKKLLESFGSISKIAAASASEVASACGISELSAQKLIDTLNKNGTIRD